MKALAMSRRTMSPETMAAAWMRPRRESVAVVVASPAAKVVVTVEAPMRPPVVRTPRVTDTSAQGLSLAPRFTAWVALGGNLGDVAATFRHALADIAALPGTHLQGVSALYETEPWQAQGPLFLNAVAAVSTALAPGEFLRSLLAIEARLGRERPYLNAPRTLDLDLVDYNGNIESGAVELPHPRLAGRAFVLFPLRDVAPDWRHPVSGKSVGELITALPAAKLEKLAD